jgi:SAM-dependent methyltransferase
MTDPTPLDFTGERFTPECVREIWYEHWHRYAWALPLAAGRRVLDAACGEGYGSALLSRSAASVVGLDADADTVGHAARRYAGRPGLSFRHGSVTAIDAADASFDLVVSFETIEHLLEQSAMLDEFRRVLAPDGVLLLSSPDRIAYNAQAAEPNPYHVRELDRDELLGLLRPRFAAIELYGQRLGFHSLLWSLAGDGSDAAAAGPGGPAQWLRMDAGSGDLGHGPDPAPVYYVAVCAASAGALPALPGLSVFADQQASIYSHYNAEIARLIRADHRLVALEHELADLRARLAARP